VNNAAWFAYFAASAYWAALVPASSATLLAGALAIRLARDPPHKPSEPLRSAHAHADPNPLGFWKFKHCFT
jgi:hypothetical protein